MKDFQDFIWRPIAKQENLAVGKIVSEMERPAAIHRVEHTNCPLLIEDCLKLFSRHIHYPPSTIHYPPSTIQVVFGIFEYHELLGVLWVFTTMVSTNKETIGINDKSTSVITSWLNGNPRVFQIPKKSAFDGLVSSLFRSSSSVGGRPRTSEEKCLIMP